MLSAAVGKLLFLAISSFEPDEAPDATPACACV